MRKSRNSESMDTLPPGYWKDKRVLITGAAGFVGSWLTRELSNREAIVMATFSRPFRRSQLFDDRMFPACYKQEMDVTKLRETSRVLSHFEPQIIFHLAAQAVVTVARRYPYGDFETNTLGTANLYQAIANTGITPSVVVASTDKVYGDAPIPYTEDTPTMATWPYEASKLCEEMVACSYSRRFLIPTAITRFVNIYGGADFHYDRLIPGTCLSLLRGEVPQIRSDAKYSRDYVYISDAVDGYLRLGRYLMSRMYTGIVEVFNFGTLKSYNVLEIVKILIDISGSNVKPHIQGIASHEIRDQSSSFDLAELILGWHPTIAITDGLKRTYEWYRTNP